MINYSKLTKVHSKSYSRTNVKDTKDVAMKRSCDNSKKHNETTTTTTLSKSEQNVSHNCSKYLKYCYNTVKTKNNCNNNGLKCSASNTNISVNNRSRKCNDIKTNQSLNMSRHTHTKTTTNNKANNSFIVDDVFNISNTHKPNNTITIKRKPFLTIHTTTTTTKKEEDVVHSKTNTNVNNTVESLVSNLEYKLQYKFAQLKQNSKYSKYVILKSIFEELIHCHKANEHLYQLSQLLSKLLTGFNEVITSYINENKTLKDKHEVLNNKCNLLSKDNISLKTIVHKKQNEITLLNKKLIAFASATTKSNNVIHHSNNSTDTNTHKHKQTTSQKIEGFNIHNVTDLDALYFYDKVNMDSEHCRVDNMNNGDDDTNVTIPSLNLQFKYEDVDAYNNKPIMHDTKQKGVMVMKKTVHKTKKLSNTKSLGNINHINMFK